VLTLGSRISAIVKPLTSAYRRVSNDRATRRERKALAVLQTTPAQNLSRFTRSERRSVQNAIAYLGRVRPLAVKNWYEGGYSLSDGTRSWLPSLVQDARYDQNQLTRREAMRRMRYWRQNSPLLVSALDISRQYTIGTHMPVVTSLATDTTGWRERAEAVYKEMSDSAGLNGESLFQMLCVSHDCKKTDGDILFQKTSRRTTLNLRGNPVPISRPCYQLIEGHRIETPFGKWEQENVDIIDGVQFKTIQTTLPSGEVRKQIVRAGYHIRDGISPFSNEETYSYVKAEDAIYVYTPHRVNQVRGLSDYIVVEPTLALLEDLLKLEMRAQEVQSDITTFITNGAGQLPDPKMERSLSAIGIKVANGADGKPVVTAEDIKKATEVYEKIYGGRVLVGKTGDTMQHQAPIRPAEATLNLWDFLINSFCRGSKSARILAFPKWSKGQGTEVRAELDAFNSSCICEFNTSWKPVIQTSWSDFIGWAIKNDPRLVDPPADWNAIEVSPPRSVLVDIGYDNAATLANLAAGTTNLHFIAQDLGTTRQKLIRMSVSDLILIKEECLAQSKASKSGVEVTAAEVRQSLGEVVKNLAAVKTAEAAKLTAETNANREPEAAAA
jgi:hypothetical protein